MFLRESDFLNQIQRENLDVLTEENPSILAEIILAAQSEIESYLSHRYDMPLIFVDLIQYDPAGTYDTGTAIVYPDIESDIYVSKVDANVGNDPNDPAFWEKRDPRHPLIKLYCIDLAMYHLHSRINPRNIPEYRIQRRDDAIKWLEMVAKSLITANLPTKTIPTAETGKNIRWGQSQTNQFY